MTIPCRVKCPYLVKCCPKLPPSIISASNNFPRFLSIGAIISSSDSPKTSCSTYITAPADFHNPRYFSSLCKAFKSSGASQARRFTPHKHSGETFDGPPTLERSGYEHRVGRLHPLSFWKGRGLGSGLRTLPQGRDRWGLLTIHILIILLILPRSNMIHPFLVIEIPFYGFLDTLLKLE